MGKSSHPLNDPTQYYQHTGPPETNPYPVTLHPMVGQEPSRADREQRRVLQNLAAERRRGASMSHFSTGVISGRSDGLEHHGIAPPPPKRVAEMPGVKGAVTRAIYKIPSIKEVKAYRQAKKARGVQ